MPKVGRGSIGVEGIGDLIKHIICLMKFLNNKNKINGGSLWLHLLWIWCTVCPDHVDSLSHEVEWGVEGEVFVPGC